MKATHSAHWVLLLAILLLAAGLRFSALGAQSLWNDEGTSVAVAQRPLATIARDAANDIHPPLYYWLLAGWVRLFGTSEAAVRSLSALLGVALAALTYVLGRQFLAPWTALGAALLAAINPFQVIYSQEARMYMLLAVLAAAAVLALVYYLERASWLALGAAVLLESAGLYTHYSFVFLILALNLAVLLAFRRRGVRRLLPWLGSQVVVVLIYLPWLPIALRQIRTWPSQGQATSLLSALGNAWRWLVLGPTIEAGQALVPLLAAAVAAVIGLLLVKGRRVPESVLRPQWPGVVLSLWLGLPLAAMLALGLYREAYLKFLLVAAPALSLLLASALTARPARSSDTGQSQSTTAGPAVSRPRQATLHIAQIVAALLIVSATAISLRNYYTDPSYARDDYRSIAAYVGAIGRPGDAILLDAPGQQEVFSYYYHGDLPVYPLPQNRPLDTVATEAALNQLARPGGRVYAVLWATDESDPDRFIESWLDSHAYKALDSWYGNVRLAVYAVPEQMASAPQQRLNAVLQDTATGNQITLLGATLQSPGLPAGDIVQLALFWSVERTPARRYKVFVHVLDAANHIVGQRDAEPGGGAKLTTLWLPGEVIADHYGVPIHPATPPGAYRIEAGMYDLETGRRLLTVDGAPQVWLEPLVVERPAAPAPVASLGMQHPGGKAFGAVTLLGYDAYRLGSEYQPEAPLRPGDVLHANLYWRAEQGSSDWQVTIGLVGSDGTEQAQLTAEPAEGYPTSNWKAGDVWRGQFDLPLAGDLPAGGYRLRVQPIGPGGALGEAFFSERFPVGP